MIPLQYHELMSFSQRRFAFYSAKVQLCKVKYLREWKKVSMASPWTMFCVGLQHSVVIYFSLLSPERKFPFFPICAERTFNDDVSKLVCHQNVICFCANIRDEDWWRFFRVSQSNRSNEIWSQIDIFFNTSRFRFENVPQVFLWLSFGLMWHNSSVDGKSDCG